MRLIVSFFLVTLMLLPSTSHAQSPQAPASNEEVFASGIEFGQFLENAERRKEMWHDNFGKGAVPEPILERLSAISGSWYLLAVAVDGCSDSVNTIPYLAHLVAESDHLHMRVVHPDDGRHIMEANPTPDGRPSTPTVLVLDENFEEVGVFIERPKELQDWALGEGKDLSSSEFMTAKFAWYDDDLGVQTMEAVLDIIEGVMQAAK